MGNYIPKPVKECFNVRDPEFPIFMYFWCLALAAIAIVLIWYAAYIKNSVTDKQMNIFPGKNEKTFKTIHNCAYAIIICGSVMLIQALAILFTGKCMFVPFSADNYLTFFGVVSLMSLTVFITSLIMKSYMADIDMGKPPTPVVSSTSTLSPSATTPPPPPVEFEEKNYKDKDENQINVFYLWVISLSTFLVSSLLGYAMYRITTNKEVEEKAKKQRASLIEKNPQLKTLDTLVSNGEYQIKILENQISEEDDSSIKLSLEKKKSDLLNQITTAKAEFEKEMKIAKGGSVEDENVIEKQLKEVEEKRKADLAKENQRRIKEAEEKKQKALEKQREAEEERLTQQRISQLESDAYQASLKAHSASLSGANPIASPSTPSPGGEQKKTSEPKLIFEEEFKSIKPLIEKSKSNVLTKPELDEIKTVVNVIKSSSISSQADKELAEKYSAQYNIALGKYTSNPSETGRTAITSAPLKEAPVLASNKPTYSGALPEAPLLQQSHSVRQQSEVQSSQSSQNVIQPESGQSVISDIQSSQPESDIQSSQPSQNVQPESDIKSSQPVSQSLSAMFSQKK